MHCLFCFKLSTESRLVFVQFPCHVMESVLVLLSPSDLGRQILCTYCDSKPAAVFSGFHATRTPSSPPAVIFRPLLFLFFLTQHSLFPVLCCKYKSTIFIPPLSLFLLLVLFPLRQVSAEGRPPAGQCGGTSTHWKMSSRTSCCDCFAVFPTIPDNVKRP